ncbi:MAG: hypothetical protein HZA53_13160 [Planctomycetes bacterium]|nr:hypothetical protein [Planctomycetota bacterium]
MNEARPEGGLRARVVNGRLELNEPTALPEGFVLDLVFAAGHPVGSSRPRRRAVVRSGRLVLNTPTELPEGTEVDLFADDEGVDLVEEEREALHAAIRASLRQMRAGQVLPAEEVLRRLRDRRGP